MQKRYRVSGPWSTSNIDDCIQEAMLRCLQVPSITAVGPTVTEKLTQMEKLKKVT